jgi:hypothetical protein
MKTVIHCGSEGLRDSGNLSPSDFCNLHSALYSELDFKPKEGRKGKMKTAYRLTLAVVALAIFNLYTIVLQGQDYTYTTNNGTITITGYTGPGGDISIPSVISGLPVSTIYFNAFRNCNSLTIVVIPDGVTNIFDLAFAGCISLRSITIPNNVTMIHGATFWGCTSLTNVILPESVTLIASAYLFKDYTGAFEGCTSLPNIILPNHLTSIDWCSFQACTGLTNVTLPDSLLNVGNLVFAICTNLTNMRIPSGVTNIGIRAFGCCTNLTSVTIGHSVSNILDGAFEDCTRLTGIFFEGNAPSLGAGVFSDDDNATVYYLPDTTGWNSTFNGLPTALWQPQVETSDANFGVQTNQFRFNIKWASGRNVVVESSTNLANPDWFPLGTSTITDGSSYFSDPQWTNYSSRFYRLRSP